MASILRVSDRPCWPGFLIGALGARRLRPEPPRHIDKGLYDELHGLYFLERGENVLFRGQSGVGKTMLAQNQGQAALEKGYTVRFTTLAAAVADLLKQQPTPAFERRLRRYLRPDLLILDELGYVPCDRRSGGLLNNIISRRHETPSTVITTNLGFKQWGTVFPGAACVVALVDRFSQHLHTVDIDAESWRQTKNEPPPKLTKTKRELTRRGVGGDQLVADLAAARPRPSNEGGIVCCLQGLQSSGQFVF
ncbi:MAG: ATP-binding protein [Myxococcaceae bacterium]|nr:ATP-binding protein [Myxococcaceae bacterium]